MAQRNKYFIAPDFDCPPNTAILLGHILPFPTKPYESLNSDTRTPPPTSIILTTTKTGFSATRSQLTRGKFGIWAQIFEGACGGGVGYSFDSTQEVEFKIDEIETSFMNPAGKETREYLRSCIEDEEVQAFFEGSRFRKNVYMIVGLKIAKGAKVNRGSEISRETTANILVDGTAGSIPLKSGPQAEVKGERKESTEWRDEKSFVFAYRLRKITCKKGKIIEDVDFNKGAFLDLESSRGVKRSKDLYYLIEDIDLEVDAGEKVSEVENGEEELFMWPVE